MLSACRQWRLRHAENAERRSSVTHHRIFLQRSQWSGTTTRLGILGARSERARKQTLSLCHAAVSAGMLRGKGAIRSRPVWFLTRWTEAGGELQFCCALNSHTSMTQAQAIGDGGIEVLNAVRVQYAGDKVYPSCSLPAGSYWSRTGEELETCRRAQENR